MSQPAKTKATPKTTKKALQAKTGAESARLSHYDAAGRATMVDVSAKAATKRTAVASAFVELSSAVLDALPRNPKGNPLDVARIAGIQAAKQTSLLIPMCHPLMLSHVEVTTSMVYMTGLDGVTQGGVTRGGVRIEATVTTTGPTGVEMEALTAATVAALTIYDMTKALDKGIVIRQVQLEQKTGGKSGEYRR